MTGPTDESMDALIMAGGRGTRLEADVEKPLFEVAGVPMVDRVVAALANSDADRIVVAVSPHTPETRAHLVDRATVSIVETPGEGYVADLDAALGAVEPPALTVAADLPLLAPRIVDRTIDVAGRVEGALTVCVPVALKRRLGASLDATMGDRAPTGLNVVAERSSGGSTQADHEPDAANADHEPDAANADYGPDAANADNETDTTNTETMYTSYDARLAVNVNRLSDARLAEELLCE